MTINDPKIDVTNNDWMLDFGVIYPITISKGGVNGSLLEFNFTQTLKTCGVDYFSIDHRVNVKSLDESCITLVGFGPEFLAPIYAIEGEGELDISFGNPLDEDIIIIRQEDENNFIAIPITNNPNTREIPIIVTNPGGIVKQIPNEIIKVIDVEGNFSLGTCNIFGCPAPNIPVNIPVSLPINIGDEIPNIQLTPVVIPASEPQESTTPTTPTTPNENIPLDLCFNITCGSNELCDNGVCIEDDPGDDDDGCFLGGTEILMADGTKKEINRLKKGDLILSFDFESNQEVISIIESLFVKERDSYLVVNSELKVTQEHPFSVSSNQWREVGRLKIGDYIFNGQEFMMIKSIEKIEENVEVFNLHASYPNNFFVESEGKRYLVHNKET
ncbi:MAG: polymorphic toxin-type HINT domain-containing protein [Candidatus Nanoarchaeia archaeon]|jgi:hypothetical protein|nr:polymorphic toxin-type HINT domain-containing protein [Candidatus Nanoarchaeia archaeon]|tara:strand:+ start:3461 stop:4618 length:1158 start_codon:yes stop_codon:yes gene_type:complete